MNRSLVLALAALALPAQAAQIAISHRGASAYAPEHTFFAYDLALEQDTDMIECDLILSKDEVPVCIHDETVDRTSESTGRVDSFTLAELREMDFGSWFNTANPTLAKPEYAGAHIVALEEQLDCYLRINPKMRFHVETKDSAGGRAEQIFFDLLTRKGLIATGDVANGNVQSSTVMLQSFDAGSLERMRALTPTIPTAFLFTAPDQTTLPWVLAGDGPDYIDAFAPNSAAILLDPTSVQRFHAAGHDVHAWTVNDSQQMSLLLQLGVDGIFSNNTDLLRAAIDSAGTGTTAEERGNPASFEHGCPGIAGRVSSKDGPGDVWEPTGTRGVRLKAGAGSSSGGSSSSGGGTPPADGGRYGGGLPLYLLLGLGLAAWLRRQGIGRIQPSR
ncbi:MAG: glycerophosphodiester phosphodiesterase family protein [Stagnimonas sp.]|nr:glycerophosphodiester phosphodiesterase family protein [Stagnimonas sp.]